jgi:phosphoadenosine phosphosulfate reductase
MWCKSCGRETTSETCEICGNTHERDIPAMIYWCKDCMTPIIKLADRIDRNICSLCGGETSYLCSDLRPVFPEERLLIEILIAKHLNISIKMYGLLIIVITLMENQSLYRSAHIKSVLPSRL